MSSRPVSSRPVRVSSFVLVWHTACWYSTIAEPCARSSCLRRSSLRKASRCVLSLISAPAATFLSYCATRLAPRESGLAAVRSIPKNRRTCAKTLGVSKGAPIALFISVRRFSVRISSELLAIPRNPASFPVSSHAQVSKLLTDTGATTLARRPPARLQLEPQSRRRHRRSAWDDSAA